MLVNFSIFLSGNHASVHIAIIVSSITTSAVSHPSHIIYWTVVNFFIRLLRYLSTNALSFYAPTCIYQPPMCHYILLPPLHQLTCCSLPMNKSKFQFVCPVAYFAPAANLSVHLPIHRTIILYIHLFQTFHLPVYSCANQLPSCYGSVYLPSLSTILCIYGYNTYSFIHLYSRKLIQFIHQFDVNPSLPMYPVSVYILSKQRLCFLLSITDIFTSSWPSKMHWLVQLVPFPHSSD